MRPARRVQRPYSSQGLASAGPSVILLLASKAEDASWSAAGEERLDVRQEPLGPLGQWFKVGEFFAGQLVAELNGKRVEFQQSPKGLDVLVLVFEQPEQQAQVVRLRLIRAFQGQPGLQALLDHLLKVKARGVHFGFGRVRED